MTNNAVKKTINEELERFSNKLNIFDFDDTLVSDVATIYILKPNGIKIPMSHIDYKKYVKQPGDKIDITEFNTVNGPTVNWEIMNLLKSSQNTSIILTARTANVPVENYLKTLEINVPVFAVGTDDPNLISSAFNAKRKAEWLRATIKTFPIEEIEFWDDNALNLYVVEELCKELNIKLTTHRVEFDPHKV